MSLDKAALSSLYITQEGRPAGSMIPVVDTMSEMEGLIDDAMTAFVDRCASERKERRAAIVSANSGSGKIAFSYNVLTYFHHNGSFILSWAQIVYLKGAGKGQRVIRRLPSKNGVTHIQRITAKAHPDEVDLLKSHEYQARLMRKMWTSYLATRRAAKDLAETADMVARLKEDPMVAQA